MRQCILNQPSSGHYDDEISSIALGNDDAVILLWLRGAVDLWCGGSTYSVDGCLGHSPVPLWLNRFLPCGVSWEGSSDQSKGGVLAGQGRAAELVPK